MNILDAVTDARNGEQISQLANQFGLQPQQAQAAVSALMPALAAGLQRETATPAGLSGLTSALTRGQHEKYLDDAAALQSPATVDDGNAILGHVLGSKDVSRQVASQAAQQTGIDSAILKKMLPIIATLAMGALARQSKTGGGGALADMLGGLLGGVGGGPRQGGLGGMVGDILNPRR